MDGAKIKNFIIIVLLLVNLFLLALVIHDRAADSGIRRQAQADVAAAFESTGIHLTADVPWSAAESPYTLHRVADGEYDMVKAILGKCTVQDLGGNILFYSSQRGEARFRGTGEFQIMPASGEIPISGTPLDTAMDVLKSMGLSADEDSAVIVENGQVTNVTLTCSFRDKRVYNCGVSFVFTTESLLLMDGRRPLDRGAAEEDGTLLDAATVLMRFLAETREQGLVCSQVEAVELGYVMSASASGEGSMTPFWRIGTDVGEHYINGLTGKSESIA